MEIEHDSQGLPVIRGKVVHGLLRDSWLQIENQFSYLINWAGQVLGYARDWRDTAIVRIGDGVLFPEVRKWVEYAVRREPSAHPLETQVILDSLTDIRYQTAIDRTQGTAAESTLRASRVVLRGCQFEAPLTWTARPDPEHIIVLALTALGTRHAGAGSSRGRGFIKMTLDGSFTNTCYWAQLSLRQ